MRTAHRISTEIPDGKKPFGSPKRKREDNIKMGLYETWWEDWVRIRASAGFL
jgi:hypothetical protein